MANRAHVPKFGDWQNDSPFTVVFEKARKTRNPNDPKENPDLPSNHQASSPAQPPRTPNPPRREPANHTPRQRSHGHGPSREEAEMRRFEPPSPAHSDRNSRGRPPREQPYNYNYNNNNNNDHHPYGGRVVNQAEMNRRAPPPKPIPNVRAQQQPYRPPAIPPFPGQGGNWNDDNTSYTHIFEKAREERNTPTDGGRLYGGGGRGGEETYNDTRLINHHGQSSPKSPKTCCFAWSRKGKY